MADGVKVYQVQAQVEYDDPPLIKVSQVIAQVEYEATAPGTYKYTGSVTVEITPASDYHPVWNPVTTGATLTVAPAAHYINQAPGEFVYDSNGVDVVITPASTYARSWLYTGNIPVTITPASSYEYPIHIYVGSITVEVTPASSYRLPIVGWDKYTGYGMLDVSFLTEDPPFWGVDGDITLTLDPTAALVEYEGGTLTLGAAGGLSIGGNEAAYDTVTPDISELEASGFLSLSSSCGLSAITPVAPTVSQFAGDGYLGLGYPCQISGVTQPTPAVSAFIAVGSLSVVSSCQVDSITPAVNAFAASGYLRLDGFMLSQMEVIYSADLAVALAAKGGLEITGACAMGSPTRVITALVANVGMGSLALLVGCDCAAGFLSPLVAKFRAVGGLLIVNTMAVGEVYSTWVLTGQNYEPSLFTNFNFNSFAIFQGQVYAAGENGVAILGGSDDDGTPISPGVRVGPLNFGTNNSKRLRAIQAGSGPDTVLRVNDGERDRYFTEAYKDRFQISRDIEGEEFTVDIQNFEKLDQVEFTPLVLSRK